MRLVIMRVPEDGIRTNASDDVAVRGVIRRCVGALVILRIVRDQVCKQERGRVLQALGIAGLVCAVYYVGARIGIYNPKGLDVDIPPADVPPDLPPTDD